MSSSLEGDMADHRGWRDSTMSSHSMRARSGEEERRWLKKALMALDSGLESEGIRRTSRPGV
jgi:hypothetical protein